MSILPEFKFIVVNVLSVWWEKKVTHLILRILRLLTHPL